MSSIKATASSQVGPPAPAAPGVAKVVRGVRTKEKHWEFSFRFFREIDKFGLDGKGISNSWLMSFLMRLQNLSLEKIDNILDDQQMADVYRYHPINWKAINIPIKREDIDWISEKYSNNPEEFPLEQLMISAGTGRFVGFFDENWVFNVVLIDPLHNIQPSKGYSYEVNDCSPLTCELTQFQLAVQNSLKQCHNLDCVARHGVQAALAGSEKGYNETYGVILIKFENSQIITDANELLSTGKAKDFGDIFEQGLCSIAAT